METAPDESETIDVGNHVTSARHDDVTRPAYSRWLFWRRQPITAYTDALYRRYVFRVERTRLQCHLVALLVLSLSMAILNFVFVSRVAAENVTNLLICVIAVVLIVVINTKYNRPAHVTAIAYVIGVVCLAFVVLSLPVNFDRRPDLILTPADGLWRLVLLLLLAYLFLPLPSHVIVPAGLLIAIAHVIVSIFVANHFPDLLWRQVSDRSR